MRFVEELDGDVLHLLLVDHAEMCAVAAIVLAQSAGPVHGRRHYSNKQSSLLSRFFSHSLTNADHRLEPKSLPIVREVH